jgi:hypothetical protein
LTHGLEARQGKLTTKERVITNKTRNLKSETILLPGKDKNIKLVSDFELEISDLDAGLMAWCVGRRQILER